jgi:signal transduction histidine kinase
VVPGTDWLPSPADGPAWHLPLGRIWPALRRWSGRLADAPRRAWTGWLDLAWVALWILGLAGIVFRHWESIPFHLTWITFALIYSLRIRHTWPTMLVLAAMLITTFAAIGLDVRRGVQPADELTEVPLMAAMFWVMMWHERRRIAANTERAAVSAENERLLATQRRFLQDASHQLRTPITIALGHSELLARNLADNQDKRDINVIVGELNRLRTLSERLLLIAASANPDFLRPEPVELDQLLTDALWRWRPTADRHWQLGQLDEVTAMADPERLGLAVDALLENATQHTDKDDLIRLSAIRDGRSGHAILVVQDSGSGIAPADLTHVFDRFATGTHTPGRHGTGLGLALVRAVAEGHGGQIRAQSTPGLGSRFELLLPLADQAPAGQLAAGQVTTGQANAGQVPTAQGPTAQGPGAQAGNMTVGRPGGGASGLTERRDVISSPSANECGSSV